MIRLLPFIIFVCAILAGIKVAAADGEADPFADNACVICHRDLSGRSSEIVDLEWKRSVHYRAKVGCEGCHGGSASVRREQYSSEEEFKRAAHLGRTAEFLLIHRDSPAVGPAAGRSISYLCGKCHMQIKEFHLGSPHGEFGQPTCIYCHGQGSHRIEKPTPDIIDTRSRREGGRCSQCHRAATMESVGRIKKHITEVAQRIEDSGEQYKYLETAGYRNLELEQLHHHADEALSQVRQTFHSFNMRDISKLTTSIDAMADRTSAAYELVQRLKRQQRQQTAVGTSAVLFLLIFAGLLVYYKSTFLIHSAHFNAGLAGPLEKPGQSALSEHSKSVPKEVAGYSAEKPETISFPALGIYLMLTHFAVIMACLLLVAIVFRAAEGPSLAGRLISLLCWPMLTLNPTIGDEHPGLFWPLMLTNSALWGFGIAALIYLLKRCWMLHKN